MAQWAVLITYREVFGKEPTLAALHAVLQKYQRSEVVFLLGKLNCLLGTWQNAPNYDLDARLSRILLWNQTGRVFAIRAADNNRVVFSRVTLLYLVKQACLACPEDGLLLNTREAHSDIGLCCLMANDLLLPFVPSPSDGTLQKLANLLPFSDYVAHDHYPFDIARTLVVFDEVSQLQALRQRADFMDLSSLFQQYLGLSHTIFCAMIFGAATRFLNVKLEHLQDPEALVMRSTFFQKTGLKANTIAQFFQKTTIDVPTLARRIQEDRERPKDDLTVFQQSPLIEIAPAVYSCLDPGFLVDKAGRGFYWTMFFEIGDRGLRARLASFWGDVFQEYVNYVLSKSYSAGGRFVPAPKFPNGDQAFDACLIEGRSLIVFEHKSSTIRADAKYGGDVSKLRNELHLKFVEGHDESAKGLAQLSRSLTRFLKGEDIGEIRNSEINKVYPVLVCLDSSVAVPYVGRYFNEQFSANFARKTVRQIVTPVFTLSISDVENLLGYLASFGLSDIFESYHSKNKTMLTSISSSEVPLLKNVQPGRNIVRERFSEFGRTIEKEFFGQSTSTQPKGAQ